MRVKPKIVTRRVRLLRDPNPTYVSLVDHGANQTPFTVVKSQQPGVSTMKLKLPLKKAATPAPTKTAKTEAQDASKDMTIFKMTFPVAAYKDEAAVKSYLESNRFEGEMTITRGKDEEFFTVKSGLDEADLTGIRQVPCEKGVLAWVGKFKAPEASDDGENKDGEGDDGDDKAAKGLSAQFENIKRFSWYDAYYDESKDPIDILKAGMKDGLPPGMEDIMFAVTRSIANIIKDGDGDMNASIDKVGDSMAKLVKGIANLYTTLASDDAQKSIKGLDKDKGATTFKTMVEAFIEKYAGEVTDETLQTVADGDAAEGDGKDKSAKGAASVKELDMGATIAEAVGKTVGEALKSVTDLVGGVVKTQESIVKRLDEADKRAPTRKAAPDAEITEKVVEDKSKKGIDFFNSGLRGGLGFGG